MLKLSNFPIKTLKSTPKISDNRSTSLLLQAGYIRQEMAGAYNYLPMGLRVIENIKSIVRDEMNNIGAQEILMSSLSPKSAWEQTGRWDRVDVLFKLPASDGREYGLNPTHEEVVTPLIKEFITSYKDLDDGIGVYQIQTKFRNEKRAKSGLLRGREFLMKDLYSFHSSEESLLEYYDKVKGAYKKIYDRLGIGADTIETIADGGDFTTLNSHEYQTMLPIGEDDIYIAKDKSFAINSEIVDGNSSILDQYGGINNFTIEKASEVGNIFPLMTKFSDAFDVKYQDKNNHMQDVYMGCYGIGVSRLMGVIAEYFMDERGLVWPESIAPYTHYILVMGDNLDRAIDLAQKLESNGKKVIIDDRSIGFGQKAGDAEVLGIPYRIVVSDKTLDQGGYELKSRTSDDVEIIKY